MTHWNQLRRLARSGKLSEAKAQLGTELDSHAVEGRGDLTAARLALELGMAGAAVRELHLCLKQRPDDVAALQELAEIYGERGALGKEERALRRLGELKALRPADEARLDTIERALQLGEPAPHTGHTAEAEPRADRGDAWLAPPIGELVRFLHLFSGREDVHARQWCDARQRVGYSPVRGPVTPELLRAHLGGSMTLGVYPVRLDGTATFFALDLDITKTAIERSHGRREEVRRLRRLVHAEGLRMQDELARLGVAVLLEDSGYKGRHLWGFLAEPLPADLVRNLLRGLAGHLKRSSRDLHVELFPKQGSVKEGGLGNLIKLPLGLHRRSKRRALLLKADGRPVDDPWTTLRSVARIRRNEVLGLLETFRGSTMLSESTRPCRSEGATEDPLPQPVAVPGRTTFSEVDFETNTELAALLRRCPVLERLVRQGLERRRLDHDERTILRHTLGHLPAGVLAVNYLFERCPEVEPADFLKSVLRGSPISCPKIRKRVPDLTASLPCHCEFPTRPTHYPTPVLHLDEARARGELKELPKAAEQLGIRVPEDLAHKYAHLLERHKRVEAELRATQQALTDYLGTVPDRRLQLENGTWQLVDDEGLPSLHWCPKEPPDGAASDS